MFAREGYAIIASVLLLAFILFVPGLYWDSPLSYGLFVLAAVLVAFTLYFFRDPKRTVPAAAAEGRLILSPADGKVVLIQEVHEPLYIHGPATQLSVFLSPLNVHVNRIPADGRIELVRYVPGDYLVAWHPKSSELNERSIIGLRHPSGLPILFKQIAGAVARRIVYHVREGDEVKAGQRFGIVKFGSRMDVLVPPSVAVRVTVGQRVTAGVTVLAEIPPDPPLAA